MRDRPIYFMLKILTLLSPKALRPLECFLLVMAVVIFSYANGRCQSTLGFDADDLTVSKNDKGVFISATNAGHYCLIAKAPDFSLIVGKSLNRTNSSASKALLAFGEVLNGTNVYASKTLFAFEEEPSLKMVRGKSVQVIYYILHGSFACLDRNVLTLTSYQIRLSTEKDTFEEVLAVSSESITLQVNNSFALKVTKLDAK